MNPKHVDWENDVEVQEYMGYCNSLKDFLLTPFEIKFVQNLAKDNCTYKEAAIRAGSKSKRPEQIGSELAKKPKIRAAVIWYAEKLLEAAALDEDSLIDRALKVYEQAMEDGKYSDANKSLELLMKARGMFKGIEANPSKSLGESSRSSSRFKESSTNNSTTAETSPPEPSPKEIPLHEQLRMAIEKASSLSNNNSNSGQEDIAED